MSTVSLCLTELKWQIYQHRTSRMQNLNAQENISRGVLSLVGQVLGRWPVYVNINRSIGDLTFFASRFCQDDERIFLLLFGLVDTQRIEKYFS